MKNLIFIIFILLLGCDNKKNNNNQLKEQIHSNEYFAFIKEKALEVVKTGFNAGDGYGEVWIRDYNTFIELSAEVFEPGILKENLLVFFKMQGDDWTWFGGRMIQQLVKNGFVEEAFEHIQPMVKRVKDNNGFFEWYTVESEPKGSGTFRGSAGVLYKAIELFEEFANN